MVEEKFVLILKHEESLKLIVSFKEKKNHIKNSVLLDYPEWFCNVHDFNSNYP